MFHNRRIEYFTAVASFLAAVVFAFASLAIADGHELAAGNCSVVAQFLLLTASIFGIDYKLNAHGSTTTTTHEDSQGHQKQQPFEHSQGLSMEGAQV